MARKFNDLFKNIYFYGKKINSLEDIYEKRTGVEKGDDYP